MKRFILLLAAVACAVSCTSKEPFTIGKGVNISHWLSQSDARGDVRRNYFTRDDVKAIADMGFDHIRILHRPCGAGGILRMLAQDIGPSEKISRLDGCIRTDERTRGG